MSLRLTWKDFGIILMWFWDDCDMIFGQKYEFSSEFGDIAAFASAFGANSDTFAPPFLVDGDLVLSQSSAISMYIGDKLGLNEGTSPLDERVMQVRMHDTHACMNMLACMRCMYACTHGMHDMRV